MKHLRTLQWTTIALLAASALAFLAPAEGAVWTWQCPFHRWTGWLCPGCGGTRAIHALLHGDVALALALNPLAVLSFCGGYAYLACQWWRSSVPGKSYFAGSPAWSAYGLVAAVVIFTVFRNLAP